MRIGQHGELKNVAPARSPPTSRQCQLERAPQATQGLRWASPPAAPSRRPGTVRLRWPVDDDHLAALPVTITTPAATAVPIVQAIGQQRLRVTHNCATLAAGASCTAQVTFTPTTRSAVGGTLTW